MSEQQSIYARIYDYYKETGKTEFHIQYKYPTDYKEIRQLILQGMIETTQSDSIGGAYIRILKK